MNKLGNTLAVYECVVVGIELERASTDKTGAIVIKELKITTNNHNDSFILPYHKAKGLKIGDKIINQLARELRSEGEDGE